MSIRKRNRSIVLIRWRRAYEKEKLHIERNRPSTTHLKARICGYLAGDGNVAVRREHDPTKVHHTIRFYPDHKSLIRPFNEAFFSVYSKTLKVTDYGNFFYLRGDSKAIVEDLLSFCSFGINRWRIPKLVDRKSKTEWLRAFCDSEAYVCKNYIRIKTVNKSGMSDVFKLLLYFGIRPRTYVYEPPQLTWQTNYILDIKPKYFARFSKLIGFNHSIKREKLEALLKDRNIIKHAEVA
jgi:hypothetical protein